MKKGLRNNIYCNILRVIKRKKIELYKIKFELSTIFFSIILIQNSRIQAKSSNYSEFQIKEVRITQV